MNRNTCPNCGADAPEFIQFGGADSPVTETTPDELGDGLLELRSCDACGAGIEFVLEPTDVTVMDQ